jgi:inner membrane protein
LPTCITHAVVGACAGVAVANGTTPRRLLAISVLCATLPDIDILSFLFGIPYDDLFGHRGITHAILFAALAGMAMVPFFFREVSPLSRVGISYALYFCSLIFMHGVLDAFTNGGEGVAFLAPFDNRRYFAEFTPIEVSPVNILAFFDGRGYGIILSEIIWVWTPAMAAAIMIRILLAAGRRRQESLQKVACREARMDN